MENRAREGRVWQHCEFVLRSRGRQRATDFRSMGMTSGGREEAHVLRNHPTDSSKKNEAPGGSFFFRTALQIFLFLFCTSI